MTRACWAAFVTAVDEQDRRPLPAACHPGRRRPSALLVAVTVVTTVAMPLLLVQAIELGARTSGHRQSALPVVALLGLAALVATLLIQRWMGARWGVMGTTAGLWLFLLATAIEREQLEAVGHRAPAVVAERQSVVRADDHVCQLVRSSDRRPIEPWERSTGTNFRTDLSDHQHVKRIYAFPAGAALILCTWPHGERPTHAFEYGDEVWTGLEYQVASHLIYEGLVEEGVRIVRAVRQRHDGVRRNRWNEFECGSHYARSMASWALLLACSGYSYDATKAALSFAPAVDAAAFHCFFSTGSGWGTFTQNLRLGNARRGRRHGCRTRTNSGRRRLPVWPPAS